MTDVSGLPVEAALARLRQAGIDEPRVEITRGRREDTDGELRALRYKSGVLLAARFPAPISISHQEEEP